MRAAAVFIGHLPGLKDELTAGENLTALTTLAGESVSRESVERALDAVALTGQRALPARVLSQGQRRRIGLARLMLVRRPLWILDEPLTALDAAGNNTLDHQLDLEGELQLEAGKSPDHAEGVRAFLDKRAPVFSKTRS